MMRPHLGSPLFPTRRSSDLIHVKDVAVPDGVRVLEAPEAVVVQLKLPGIEPVAAAPTAAADRKSTRLNSSHSQSSYAVFCLKKKNLLLLGKIDVFHNRRNAS